MENVPNRLEAVRTTENVGQNAAKVQYRQFNNDQSAMEIEIPYIDHTLGHILKHELEQNSHIEYVSLKQPHPLEHKVIMRVQAAKETLDIK